MKLILILLSAMSFTYAQECDQEIYAYELAYEYHRDQKEMPEDIEQRMEELKDIRLCKDGENLYVLSGKEVEHTHLVNIGVYLGMPWITGGQVTYTKMKDDKYSYHLGVAAGGSLSMNGIGVKYGKHINGKPFYVGGALYGIDTGATKGALFGPTVGLSGGKGIVNLHAEVGLMGVYDSMHGFSVFPHVQAGVRIRLFKGTNKKRPSED